eukprot:scaffold236_cov419-Prasinococcus_capsulatus_cf.AAC.1
MRCFTPLPLAHVTQPRRAKGGRSLALANAPIQRFSGRARRAKSTLVASGRCAKSLGRMGRSRRV